MSYEPPFTTNAKIDALCLEIAELVGSFNTSYTRGASLKLHRRLRVRTIRSSLMIEGNTLPEDAVTAIFDGKRVLGPKRDIREVQNAVKAYEMLDALDFGSIKDLLHTHKVLMEELVPHPGRLRSKNAGVFDGDALIHAGTPAKYVPAVMKDLFTWMKSCDLHPLIMSCIFHYEFEFIHPFEDGNGRLGRLWHTLILSSWRPALAWLPVESIILDRQQEYYRAFIASEHAANCATFVAFMLTVIRDALERYTPGSSVVDARAEQILEFFATHPTATMNDLAAYLGCSKRSAERCVASLKAAGRIARNGSARAGTWEVL